MKLQTYLEDKGLTAAEFARAAGFASRQVVHKYLTSERFPSPDALLRIRTATGGAVTADDFVDQHTQPVQPPKAEAAA